MATAVQIELMVDEKGAVSGVRSFDTAVKTTSGSVRQLNTELNAVGTRAAAAGQKGKQGLDQVGKAALGSKEQVRLLSEEIGIHIPRAMQGVIAKCPAVTTALGAISSAMIGIGAIQIGGMMFDAAIKGAEKLYQKWLDVDGAIKRYNDEAGEAASKKFYENAGLDQLNADLRQANQQLTELNQKRINSPQANMGPSATQFATPGIYKVAHLFGISTPEHFGVSDAHAQNEAQGRKDDANLPLMEKDHQKALQKIDDERLITEAKLTGIAKARAARDADNKKADEDARYALQHAQALAEIANRGIDNKKLKPGDKGYRYAVTVSPDTGKTEEADAKAHADAEFKAQQFEIGRERTEERIKLHNEAINAALRGEALYKAETEEQIAELTRRGIASPGIISDAWEKYHAEEKKRNDEQARQTAEIVEQARLAGLTGIARIQTEGDLRISKVNSDPNLNPDQRKLRTDALQEQTNAEVGTKQLEWTRRVNEVVEQSQERQVSGFGRIRMEAEKASTELQRQFDEAHNFMDLNKPGAQKTYDEDTMQLGRGLNSITAGAGKQSGDLAEKNKQETEQIEAQAYVRSLSVEKQRTASINAEYKERITKYEDWKKQELASDQLTSDERASITDNANRRSIAAAQERDAQLVEAATEARKKMAGEFEGFFRGMEDPKRYLREMGDKAAGNAAATLFQGFHKRQVGTNTDQGTGEHAGFFDGMLNDFGIHGKNKLPGAGADAKAATHTVQAAQGIISVSSATIHIGSASFAGSGGFGGGANVSGNSTNAGNASLSVPGSTSLLAPSNIVTSSDLGAPTGASGAGWGGAGMTNLGTPLPGTSGAGGMGGGAESFESGTGVSSKIGGTVSNLKQGDELYKQFKTGFSGAGGSDSSGAGSGIAGGLIGKLNDSNTAGKMFGGKLFGSGSFMENSEAQAKVGGSAEGVMGVYSASQGGGGAGGALKGAMSGAEAGSIAGPIGMAAGAVVGGVIGAIGSSEPARVYDLKTVRPRIANDKDAYQQGSMDYLSALSDMESLQSEAFRTLSAMGTNGRHYRDEHITPEIKQAEAHLTAQEKAGRSQYTATAAQYDTGGVVNNFGNLTTTPGHGLVNMQLGEFTVRPNVYQRNKSTLDALNAGASMDAIHANYRSAMQSNDARSGSGGNRTMNMNVHAIDSKGVAEFLDTYKHQFRGAMNDSYAENSGGGL